MLGMSSQRPTSTTPPPDGWNHWPGQIIIHPDTQVLHDGPEVEAEIAMRWAMVPTRWNGEPWWYGWAPVTKLGEAHWGYWLFRRDPDLYPCTTDRMCK